MSNEFILQAFQNGVIPERPIGKVIVVGAGIAGLTAAHILAKSGIMVTLLEATARYGGRIHTLTGFADCPIEVGAEEIHGGKTAWADLLEQSGKKMLAYENVHQDLYRIDAQLITEKEAFKRADFQQALDFWDIIKQYPAKDKTLSVYDLMQASALPQNIQHIVEAWLSNAYGTHTKNIGVLALQKSWVKWSAGESNFVLEEAGLTDTLAELFQDILPKIHFSEAVTSIDYSKTTLKIITEAGNSYTADKVILTVPLPILQKEKITFTPPLPAEKQQAIQTIGIDTGLKLILKFKASFWGENIAAIYGDGYFSEFYPAAKNEEAILTALVMGEKARYLGNLQRETLIYMALFELDAIFGDKAATRTFIDYYLMDWGKEPYICGAYSYPSVGSDKARFVLSQPIRDQLFFAGEATCTNGHHATVHGALESGAKSALEVLGKQI
jgi:monoamine oxidase